MYIYIYETYIDNLNRSSPAFFLVLPTFVFLLWFTVAILYSEVTVSSALKRII